MNRRMFFHAASAASVLSVPLGAWAQPQSRVYRICFLSPNARDSPTSKAALDTLRGALAEVGYVEGRNIAFDARWAEGSTERLPQLAAELAAQRPDVIVALTTPATLASKQAATATTPIVMINVTDPVGAGLVASLARPGGNVTGVTDFGIELVAKSVELAREIIPTTSRLAVLVSDNPIHPFQLREIEKAAKRWSVAVVPASATTANELEHAIVYAKANADALIVLGGGVQSGNRERIAELANHARLPTLAYVRAYVDAGALASYGHKVLLQYRVAARLVDKILKGARSADLPVEQPLTFELVVNLRTAKALGIAISPQLLSRADDLVQ